MSAEFAVAVVVLVVVAGIPQVAIRIAVVSVESEHLRATAAVAVPVAVVAGNPKVAVRIAVASVESEQLRAPAAVEVAVAVAEPLMVAVFAVEPWT